MHNPPDQHRDARNVSFAMTLPFADPTTCGRRLIAEEHLDGCVDAPSNALFFQQPRKDATATPVSMIGAGRELVEDKLLRFGAVQERCSSKLGR